MKFLFPNADKMSIPVAPLAGAWIEMISVPHNTTFHYVAPLAGAWIEMLLKLNLTDMRDSSLPSRERGLKFEEHGRKGGRIAVAPLAGAWIEILLMFSFPPCEKMSLPSRERGLKFHIIRTGDCVAWSLPSRERGLKYKSGKMWGSVLRRSPRGSVD